MKPRDRRGAPSFPPPPTKEDGIYAEGYDMNALEQAAFVILMFMFGVLWFFTMYLLLAHVAEFFNA